MIKLRTVIILCLSLLICGTIYSQNQFIGASKCKMCHNKPATGDQFKKWSESAHANAWKDLASAKAIEVGKKKGVTNPQTDAKCLKCHSTGAHNDKAKLAGLTAEEGVSCEECHGAGSAYKAMGIMKNREEAIKNGLIIPNEKTCTKCHNPESPTYKPFDFATYSKKIAHNIPK